MSVLSILHNHYGSTLLEHENDIGIEINSITSFQQAPRPYITIKARIVSYGEESNAINEEITESIFTDTGTSKTLTDLITIFKRNPEGISRRDLLSRHRITAHTLEQHRDALNKDFELTEEKVYTQSLTPGGREQYETRLFLRNK